MFIFRIRNLCVSVHAVQCPISVFLSTLSLILTHSSVEIYFLYSINVVYKVQTLLQLSVLSKAYIKGGGGGRVES